MVYLLVFAACIGVARFFLPAHSPTVAGSYQAFAHLFVGGLFGAYFASRKKFLLYIALALTVLEVVAAVITRLV